MKVVLFLFLASSLLGLGLICFSWLAIAISGPVIAFLSAVVLYHEGFSPFVGIATIVAYLVVNQVTYLIGVMLIDRRTNNQGANHDQHI